MATTAKYNLPYLAPNDPPDLAGATQDLAEATESTIDGVAIAYAVAGGHATVEVTPGTSTQVHVDFPPGRFSVSPLIFANVQSGSPDQVREVVHNNVTAAGCDLWVYRTGPNPVTTGIDWWAVQITSATADG
ncbi:MAG: hypothetical protein ACRDMV_21285 [Streptosporangiales bacterium]